MEDDLNALIAEMEHTENRPAKARIGKKMMEMAAKIIEADNQRVMAGKGNGTAGEGEEEEEHDQGLAEGPAEDDKKKKDAGQRAARVPAAVFANLSSLIAEVEAQKRLRASLAEKFAECRSGAANEKKRKHDNHEDDDDKDPFRETGMRRSEVPSEGWQQTQEVNAGGQEKKDADVNQQRDKIEHTGEN
ncbi:putative NRPS-like protein biosynthetic cluster [Ascosphaera pollenicola]|nr:putative NRPS-like protein biosynthetic cluster [Ascosphaera pollenicola]